MEINVDYFSNLEGTHRYPVSKGRAMNFCLSGRSLDGGECGGQTRKDEWG